MKRAKQQSLNEFLVIRAQQGDRISFNQLLQRWQQRYYGYALNRLGNSEAAKDVCQDCLLSISRSLGGLSDPAAFPTWSFRILERRCVDWLRKTIREREAVVSSGELPETAVEDRTTAEDASTEVKKILRSMDGRLATVLRLYYLEELPVTDIGEILNVPTGTVKSRLFYARKLFVDAIAQQRGDSDE
ncbi:MAG: RNA polymerase sigma factor [Gammaproteobacteria bacterium]